MSGPATILSGAFERHNFGDLLMGRVLERFLRTEGMYVYPASVLPADLRGLGGLRVHSFADLAPFLPSDIPIVHCGGETIPCSMASALYMNVPESIVGKLRAKVAKVAGPTGLDDRRFAYLTPPEETIRGRRYRWERRYFYAQGASTLAEAGEADRREVRAVLEGADRISAREESSVRALRECGVDRATQARDAGILVPALAGPGLDALDVPPHPVRGGTLLIHANAKYLSGESQELVRQMATLRDRFRDVKVGLAGIAAGHDSFESAGALVAALTAAGWKASLLPEIHADAIVAAIAGASCVVSTSLHYRILAMTFGVPRVSLANAKVAAWARCCDPGFPCDCGSQHVAEAVDRALRATDDFLVDTAMTARREARDQLRETVQLVRTAADAATGPPFALPEEIEIAFPGRDHRIVPAAWLEAIGAFPASLEVDLRDSKTRVAKLKRDLADSRDALAEIRKSLAWKATSPFRRIARLWRKPDR